MTERIQHNDKLSKMLNTIYDGMSRQYNFKFIVRDAEGNVVYTIQMEAVK